MTLEEVLKKYNIKNVEELDRILQVHQFLNDHEYCTLPRDDFDLLFERIKVLDTLKSIIDFNVYELQGSYYLTTGNNYRGQIPIDKETYETLKGEKDG